VRRTKGITLHREEKIICNLVGTLTTESLKERWNSSVVVFHSRKQQIFEKWKVEGKSIIWNRKDNKGRESHFSRC